MVELVVALALVALVATAAARMLAGHQRSYRNQSERLAMAQNVRAALAILRFELRELGTDPTAGDIIDMTPHSISYEAARGVLHLCTPPELAARKVTLAARGTASVARVGVTVSGRSSVPIRGLSGILAFSTFTLHEQIALRNARP